MARNQTTQGARGVPDGTWYRDSRGKYWVLINTSKGKAWRQNGPQPGPPLVELKGADIPSDAPFSPNATRSTNAFQESLGSINAGSLKGKTGHEESSTLRYPSDGIKDKNTDYVLFQFGKYNPPFGTDAEANSGSNPYEQYNQSVSDLELKSVSVKNLKNKTTSRVESIVLPMPQDLSNELKSDWSAKSFTRLGRTAIAAAAGGRFSDVGKLASDFTGNLQSIQGAVVSNILNKIPGVGGNLSINDITGSTRGIVLNPNAEVLYDSPNMREIGMVFKMVPRNDDEAATIKMICDAFRSASLPRYGASDTLDDEILTSAKDNGTSKDKDFRMQGDNFIRVPYLCKFTFMSGSDTNSWVAQFKPCAITRVQVNYTPDGTYATYTSGSPVATELSINFLESKVIFENEVAGGF